MALNPFQDLFLQNYLKTPDGRYFLPFANTQAGQSHLGTDAFGSEVPVWYGAPNEESSGGPAHTYYSLQDYWNAEHPIDPRIGGGAAQNGLGYNLDGLTSYDGIRGTYNDQPGYYLDPNRVTGTHPATTGGSKPNDSGLWQMLSLILPAAAGVYGAVASGAVAGGGAAAGEAGVASSAGSGAAAGAAGESGVAASGASSGGAAATGAEAGSAATQAPAAATAADNTLANAMQTINSTPGLKSQLLNETVGGKNASYLSPILSVLGGESNSTISGSSGNSTLSGGSGNDTLSNTAGGSTENYFGDYIVDPDTGDVTVDQNARAETNLGNYDSSDYRADNPGEFSNTADPDYQALAEKYGPTIAKQILARNGAGKQTLGQSILGQVGSDPLGAAFSATPFLLALAESNRQSGDINSTIGRMRTLEDSVSGNASPYMTALLDPYDMQTGQGRNALMQDQALRGVRGSSFGDQSLNSYDYTRGVGRADIGSKALLGAAGLRGTLMNSELGAINARNTNRNLLLGAGLNASGRLFQPEKDPFNLNTLFGIP